MSKNALGAGTRTERCPDCDRRTEHEVSIRLVEERSGSAFAREPYRTSECQVCGTKRNERLN